MDESSSWSQIFREGYDDSIRYKMREGDIKEKIENAKKKTNNISDTKLAKLLRRDCEELVINSENKAWKSVLIISGSIIEAILLEETKKDNSKAESVYRNKFPKSNKKSLDEWVLHELIKVCNDLGILTDGEQDLLNIIKNYRNLIHPGKEIRDKDIEITEEVAEISKNLVFLLLRKFYKKQA